MAEGRTGSKGKVHVSEGYMIVHDGEGHIALRAGFGLRNRALRAPLTGH